MFIKLWGVKLRVECIVISMIIGALLGCHLACGCLTREGMETIGSAVGYKMADGVHTDKYEKKVGMLEVNGGGQRLNPTVPLPEGQLFMWANNEFSGKCCESSNVSGGNGCACITKEQNDYLNSRGGNRSTCSSEY